MIQTTATELPRLMRCLGSYDMPPALPPDEDMTARTEGNAAHWLATMMFTDHAGADPKHWIGTPAYNGYVITEEMVDHVADYVSALHCGEMEVDTSYSSPAGQWHIGGRADHLVCVGSDLIVDDFKYGHRLVEVVENWTLISHAIGWCFRTGFTPRMVTLRIHQPRAYHSDGPLREWSLSYIDLMDRYRMISERLSSRERPLMSSVEHCAKCHALAACPAARMAAMNAIDASALPFVDNMPDGALAWELETLARAQTTIENRLGAIQELMTHRIENGHDIKGYHLKARYANTRWRGNPSGKMLTAMTGVDCVKDATITPAEAKRRGVPEAVVDAMTERPMIGRKLERINVDQVARNAFGDR